MNDKYVFQILEIEPTDDIREIKKAYARMVKKYHPEEYPEKWKAIHDAYEIALKIAKQGQSSETLFRVKESSLPPEVISKEAGEEKENHHRPPVTKTEKKTETEGTADLQYALEQETSEDQSLIAMFENIEGLSQEQLNLQRQKEEAEQKALQEILKKLRRLAVKRRFSKKEWESFFQQEGLLAMICRKEYLYLVGNCFSDITINKGTYFFMMEQLQVIRDYLSDNGIVISYGKKDPLSYIESQLSAAYKVDNHDYKKPVMRGALIAVLLCVIRYIYMYGDIDDRQESHAEREKWKYEVQEVTTELSKEEQEERAVQQDVYEPEEGGKVLEKVDGYQYMGTLTLSVDLGAATTSIMLPMGEMTQIYDDSAISIQPGIDVAANIKIMIVEDYLSEVELLADSYYKYYVRNEDKYRNIQMGEILPVTDNDEAWYVSFTYEAKHDPKGEFLPQEDVRCMIKINEYYLLEYQIVFHPEKYDQLTNAVIKELEAAYGIDLSEFYNKNDE